MKERVDNYLEKRILKKHIPGAVLQIQLGNDVVYEKVYGYRMIYPKKEEMKLDTIFDLASLTKVVATLPLFLMFADGENVSLEDRVTKYLPDFTKFNKGNISIRQLLTHSSGLKAHAFFAEKHLTTRDEILKNLINEKCIYENDKEVLYSDVGFALLSIIAEEIADDSFENLCNQMIFEPLEMNETGFNPKFGQERYAATEYSDAIKDYKLGVVHDENTFAIGGISGHAGLFSTISDLGNFAKMISSNGSYNGNQLISEQMIHLAKNNHTPFSDKPRGIGWELNDKKYASCGDLFSDQSFGHTGFTGTSMWFDPEINLTVVLLTNRVHLGRENHILSLRPELHTIIKKHIIN